MRCEVLRSARDRARLDRVASSPPASFQFRHGFFGSGLKLQDVSLRHEKRIPCTDRGTREVSIQASSCGPASKIQARDARFAVQLHSVFGLCLFCSVAAAALPEPRLGDPSLKGDRKQECMMQEQDIVLLPDGRLPTNHKTILKEVGKAARHVPKFFPNQSLTTVRMLYHGREFLQGGHLQLRRQISLAGKSPDPLESLFLLHPRGYKFGKVEKPIEGSTLQYESNLSRAWSNLNMKAEHEMNYCLVTQAMYEQIMGTGATEDPLPADDADEQDGEPDGEGEPDDAEPDSDSRATPSAPDSRHVWPWMGPEEYYRNLYRAYAFQDAARVTIVDFNAGAGNSALAAIRDGRPYIGFCRNETCHHHSSCCELECRLCH